MRFSAVALLGFAAIAYAQDAASAPAPDAVVPGGDVQADPTVEGGDVEVDNTDPAELYKGPFGFPPGIAAPGPKHMPKGGPPKDMNKGKDGFPVWHPPHKGVFIDDCDDDKDDKWHWAHKGSKHPKPIIPHHKWTTSTVTATKTKTVIDCPDKVPHCPAGKIKTKYTTTTIEVTTTICPVPITGAPAPPPHPPKPTAAAPPPPPPKPTNPAPASPPPAPTGAPVVPNVPAVSKPPVIVSAGAAQNAVGALAAVAALVAALI